MGTSPKRSTFQFSLGTDQCLAFEVPSKFVRGVITEESTSCDRGSTRHGERTGTGRAADATGPLEEQARACRQELQRSRLSTIGVLEGQARGEILQKQVILSQL